jgi:cell division protein FtsQ
MPGFNRIRNGLLMAGWIILGVSLLTLLIAAMNTKSTKPCTDVVISYKNKEGAVYTSKWQIARILDEKGLSVLKGKSIKNVDLKSMEDKLEKDPWIKNAELFFDNKRVLRVNIEENQPIARLFTLKGNTFYLDSNMKRLPLNERHTPRLPVFTSVPVDRFPWTGKDSVLMTEVKQMALFLNNDPFWMAQIDKCDINAQRSFELIPKVGDHLIIFGDGKNIQERFRKLTIFYQQVLPKTGFNSYSDINIQFEGQVVATKRNSRYVKSDTLLSRQWMRQWIQMTQQPVLVTNSTTLTQQRKEGVDNPSLKRSVPDSMKTKPSTKNPVPGKPKETGTKGTVPAEKTKPKAVMPQAEKES